MPPKLRDRLTYANVVSTMCLFLLLGGIAYAAFQLPKNSVGSRHIKPQAVKRTDLARNSVNSTRVANGSLRAADFGAGQLPSGPTGPAGLAGPTGPAGATSVVRRQGSVETVPPDDSGAGGASCEDGEQLISGGVVANSGTTADFVLVYSFPTTPIGSTDPTAPTGWLAQYYNRDSNGSDTGNISFRSFAVCASP